MLILVMLMKTISWKPYLLWILIAEAVGGLSGWLTREGSRIFSETVAQPPLSPPAWAFPLAWGILYALMGISAARVCLNTSSPERSKGLNLFITQLTVNFFWSLIFFNAQAYGFAFLWLVLLWILIVGMIFLFSGVDGLAALLQIPYLLWVTFAGYLNYAVWRLNP